MGSLGGSQLVKVLLFVTAGAGGAGKDVLTAATSGWLILSCSGSCTSIYPHWQEKSGDIFVAKISAPGMNLFVYIVTEKAVPVFLCTKYMQTEIYCQCFQYFQYFKLRCPWTSPNLWLCKTVQPRLMGESSLCPLCHLWLPIKANNFTISQCLYGTEEAWQDQPSFCFGQESQNWARIKNFPWKLEGSN